jgi:hypothetical protein
VSKARLVTRRVYNFHKDNLRDIVAALLTNYVYAAFMVGVPVFLYVGNVWLILMSMLGAYTMLTVVINRPRYETMYGRFLMIIACTAGGMTSFLIGEFVKTIL